MKIFINACIKRTLKVLQASSERAFYATRFQNMYILIVGWRVEIDNKQIHCFL